MRKIMLLIALCISIGANAQTSTGTDTLTNAGTLAIQTPVSYFNQSQGTWTASITATKISGTTAGYAILQTTVDGTNYTNLYGDSRDTFTLSNVATQSKNWYVSGVKPNRVRINVIGSGTQSTQIKGYYIKNQN